MSESKGAPGKSGSRGERMEMWPLTPAMCEMAVVDRQHPWPVRRMGRKHRKILYLFKWPCKTQLNKTVLSPRMSAGAV